eukprot:TRINITY_DN622_c0_g1_i3.p1 TRINITY_DN622_c0_g1~~TRINITY_DN622_c0_g1_i3.p1  ORF type:complete len:208 (-),score=51.10 TRINITY_DN622_c0_g1_i3:90-713(-)
MADKFNLDKGLGDLDKYLLDESYIQGYQPSSADLDVFNKIKDQPDNKFRNVARWYKHIKSYSDAERATWKSAGGSEPEPAAQEEEEVDLFGDDTEDDKKEREALAAQRASQPPPKKGPIAKSSIIFDVKPLAKETNLQEMEEKVRAIVMEGLEWKASKLVDVAFGIQKLQISCNVIDDLVSTDELEEKITDIEDYVQSVDIIAFNKI